MEEKDVLVVEDNLDLLKILDAFYSLLPYTYEMASSADEAMKILEKTKFKVYVLDINLGSGRMHGVDLSLIVRRRDKKAKIYALTGHWELFDDIDHEVAGFDAVYFKPEQYKDLVARIAEDLGYNK